ncbi:hypothetical protein ENC19_27560 [Verrucosispora sp. CWR15]|uniref:Uncharacterized protein n=1 Tax=Verrucosispora sioxanthis TaxID=2499994 RepID=A0A6M1LCY3_9ACTN|nr:hypothetical protein [Verrucosispora sioxanthis]NEE67010.1 hypothetical protein [Verrucosispora sioxanthis]NGM16120.1 hypothetical protein [Verrucosispora sioxanthis]
MSREAVTRWLRLVEADAELSAYLIGVDRDRLAAHLARQLAARGPVLDGWPGLPEAQRRRAAGYLAGPLHPRPPGHRRGRRAFRAELRCPGLLRSGRRRSSSPRWSGWSAAAVTGPGGWRC